MASLGQLPADTGLTFSGIRYQDLGGDSKAMWWEEPQADGTYVVREWSWSQYHEDTMAAARSFIALGVVSCSLPNAV